MTRLGFSRPISWSFLPASAPVSGTLGRGAGRVPLRGRVLRLLGHQRPHIAELEGQLLRKADLVITSAERLYANKVKANPQHRARAPRGGLPPLREGVRRRRNRRAGGHRALPKPIIGFFGLVADWVDQDAMAACARAYPEGSVVVSGEGGAQRRRGAARLLPNVHLLGRKPYAELPGYCKAFDVALMPFR